MIQTIELQGFWYLKERVNTVLKDLQNKYSKFKVVDIKFWTNPRPTYFIIYDTGENKNE